MNLLTILIFCLFMSSCACYSVKIPREDSTIMEASACSMAYGNVGLSIEKKENGSEVITFIRENDEQAKLLAGTINEAIKRIPVSH